MTGEPSSERKRFSLGLAPERRWPETECLRRDKALLTRVGERVAWLLADGVRELLANAWLHGAPSVFEGDLEIDESIVVLRIPGSQFDSKAAAAEAGNRWLHRYGRMLAKENIVWTWRREGTLNVIELRLDDVNNIEGGRS